MYKYTWDKYTLIYVKYSKTRYHGKTMICTRNMEITVNMNWDRIKITIFKGLHACLVTKWKFLNFNYFGGSGRVCCEEDFQWYFSSFLVTQVRLNGILPFEELSWSLSLFQFPVALLKFLCKSEINSRPLPTLFFWPPRPFSQKSNALSTAAQ